MYLDEKLQQQAPFEVGDPIHDVHWIHLQSKKFRQVVGSTK